VRSALALGACLLALAAACGGASRSPESVVRAWSRAIDSGDNDAAADLFASDAEVVQAGGVTRLHTHADAVAWNAGLPCSGRIVALSLRGEVVRATFLLGDRQATPCDGPGERATAIFRVHRGKIVLWHQVAEPGVPGPTTTV
jgi:limonene-1,2-epoxide hydrolase